MSYAEKTKFADLVYGAQNIEPASTYSYLAEILLRRLLNRIRNSLGSLYQTSSTGDIRSLTDELTKHEDSIQQWYECLRSSLRFALPHELEHPGQEDELVQLIRERYMQALELLRRPYLYLCSHTQLDDEMRELCTSRANECLRLAAYGLQTEKPFCRHPGSWGSCRMRFNHALCLIAASKAKATGRESARDLELPPSWEGLVRLAIDRLKVWQEEGAGIAELSILLEWLLHT